ncbi:MAG: hypothetical protein JSS61_02405 [Verrucomicrobia bacterium]|nr:hypothetical protein [Verrucomicrobiota bacterium]
MSTSAIGSNSTPAYVNTERTVRETIIKFFKEKTTAVIKAVGYAAGWCTVAKPDMPQAVHNLSGAMSKVKNAISITELPERANKFYKSGRKFIQKPSWQAGRSLVQNGALLVNATTDGVDFAKDYVPVDKHSFTVLKGVNFGASAVGCGLSAYEQVKAIREMPEVNVVKTSQRLLNLARDVSYVALGVIGLLCIITGTAFIPWVMLACLTSGLFFTVGGYFHEKLVVNRVDPAKVAINLRRENEWLRSENTRLATPGAA